MKNIEQEIKEIKLRNKRVEADKAWETSNVRKIIVAVITYLFMTAFFYTLNVDKPYINSLVPTFGYLLSTLTLNLAKRVWTEKFYKK